MQRVIISCAAIAACMIATGPPIAQEIPQLTAQRVFPSLALRRPVALLQAPGDASRWYAVEQAGRVVAFAADAGVADADLVIDLRDRVEDGPNEAGLLGMAFHPDFAVNRQVYLSYTRGEGTLTSVIARFAASADGRRLDPASMSTVLTLRQPYGNHNGGHIAFGPDGYLYAGFGDGGAAGDPHAHAQNTGTLLGTILRIEVNTDLPYAIPPDNPFANGGGRAEIFAWGLRNPWRFSFDRETGELWAGDVGQNAWEEINLIAAGGNYGWNLREGAHPFRGANDPGGLIDPVAEYGHRLGCSVTGGYVYRGDAMPRLEGVYLYGDYCSGVVWGLRGAGAEPQILAQTGLRIGTFAEGADGEIYLLDHRRGGIYHLRLAN